MTLTDVLAWVGAITGSLASLGILWDVYKWRLRGPDVHVQLRQNMVLAGPRPESQPEVCLIEVVNRGALPTTLTHVLGEHYTTLWQRVRRKPKSGLFIPQGGVLGSIPHVLEPGGMWLGQVAQDQLAPLLKNGRVRLGVQHSWSKKGVYQWLSEEPNRSQATRAK